MLLTLLWLAAAQGAADLDDPAVAATHADRAELRLRAPERPIAPPQSLAVGSLVIQFQRRVPRGPKAGEATLDLSDDELQGVTDEVYAALERALGKRYTITPQDRVAASITAMPSRQAPRSAALQWTGVPNGLVLPRSGWFTRRSVEQAHQQLRDDLGVDAVLSVRVSLAPCHGKSVQEEATACLLSPNGSRPSFKLSIFAADDQGALDARVERGVVLTGTRIREGQKDLPYPYKRRIHGRARVKLDDPEAERYGGEAAALIAAVTRISLTIAQAPPSNGDGLSPSTAEDR